MNTKEYTFEYEKILKETAKAILFEVEDLEIWIPKSEIRYHDEKRSEVTIPEWLAKEKELM